MSENKGATSQEVAPTPIDIILPVHGRPELTVKAVKAIYGYTSSPFHLIVLDDTDASLERGSFHGVAEADVTSPYFERLVKQYNNITYINSATPYKEGNEFFNEGLRYCKHDYVATIMNSITVYPDWENHALELFKQDPQIGTIGFKNLLPNDTIESAGIIFKGCMPCDYGRDAPGFTFSFDMEIPATQWAFAIHRKKAIMGNLCEGIFHGFVGWDDIDNCLAIRSKGWKVFYCGHGVGTHQPRATRGTDDIEAVLKNRENSIAFYKRWDEQWGFWKMYQEGNKLDISYKLKPEIKAKLTGAILEYQVLQVLLKERQDAMATLAGEALEELGVSKEEYFIEMNPQQNIWDLKMIPEKVNGAKVDDNGKGKAKLLKKTKKVKV